MHKRISTKYSYGEQFREGDWKDTFGPIQMQKGIKTAYILKGLQFTQPTETLLVLQITNLPIYTSGTDHSSQAKLHYKDPPVSNVEANDGCVRHVISKSDLGFESTRLQFK